MPKKSVKILINISLISIVLVIGACFCLKNINKTGTIRDINFSIENVDLLATTETESSAAVNSNFTNEKIKGSTVWPIVNVYKYNDKEKKNKKTTTLAAYTECLVVQASIENKSFLVKYVTNGKGWNDTDVQYEQSWVNSDCLLINLPDICDGIQYDITNGYKSIFKIGSANKTGGVHNISNITGKDLYQYDNDNKKDGKVYNPKLNKEECVCPLIFPFAEEVATAEKKAEARGYNLKIYDAYRPQDVCNSFAENYTNLVNSGSVPSSLVGSEWGLGWFVATGVISDHARGIAIDVTLVKKGTQNEISAQSDMHDLSQNSVKTSYSDYSNSGSYNVAPTKGTEGTKILHEIMVNDAGLDALPSEWWHYNTKYNSTIYKNSTDNNRVGYKNVAYTPKNEVKQVEDLVLNNTHLSPSQATYANERTATITANKTIKSITSSKGKKWEINKSNPKQASFTYDENIVDTVKITDIDGLSKNRTVTIKNIIASLKVTSGPLYDEENSTNKDVTVSVKVNNDIKTISGGTGTWKISDANKKQAIGTYSTNVTKDTIKITDIYNQTIQVNNITINNIDKSNLTVSTQSKIIDNKMYVLVTANREINDVKHEDAYSYGNSIQSSIKNKLQNAGMTLPSDLTCCVYYVYNKNYGKKEITVKDLFGNEISQELNITGIDDKGPTLTVKYKTSAGFVTNSNYTADNEVQVQIEADEEVKTIDGWSLSTNKQTLTKTFDENTTETKQTVSVKDKWGNTSKATIYININTNPVLEKIIYSDTSENAYYVTVNMVINKEVKEPEGWLLEEGDGQYSNKWILTKTYDNNTGEAGEQISIQDKSNNKIIGNNETSSLVNDGNVTIKVNNIDENVRVEKVYYYPKKENAKKVYVQIYLSKWIDKINGQSMAEQTSIDGWTWSEYMSGKVLVSKSFEENGEKTVKLQLGENTVKSTEETSNFVNNNTGEVSITINNISEEAAEDEISKVRILNGPTKVNYYEGDSIDLSGLKLEITDSVSNVTEVNYDNLEDKTLIKVRKINESNWNTEINNLTIDDGKLPIEVSYNDYKSEENIRINVSKRPVESIRINEKSNYKTKYYTNDTELDTSNLIIDVKYEGKDGYEEKSDGFTIDDENVDFTIPGRKKIIVTYQEKTTSFYINVTDNSDETKSVKEISIKEWPFIDSIDNKKYYEGDNIDTTGLILYVTYTDNSKEEIAIENLEAEDYKVSKEKLDVGLNYIKITYQGKTATKKITASKIEAEEFNVTKTTDNLPKYNINTLVDLRDIQVQVKYNNSDTPVIIDNIDDLVFEPEVLTESGTQEVTVYLKNDVEKFATFEVEVKDVELEKIDVTPNLSKVYYKGDKINKNLLDVIATYSDGTKDYIETGYTVEPEILENTGEQEITVTYNGKSAVFNINVTDAEVESIAIIEEPSNKTFIIGEILGKNEKLMELVVQATYTDGSKQNILIDELEIPDVILDSEGTKNIIVGYKGKETSFNVTVRKMNFEVLSISKMPQKLNYNKGDTLDVTGIALFVREEYGEIKEIDPTVYNEITYSPMELNEVGTQKIIVQHGDGNDYATFDVNVQDNKNGESSHENENENQDKDNNDSNKEPNKVVDNQKSNQDSVSDKKNIDKDNKKTDNKTTENVTKQNNYIDPNTANSRLPQTGTQQEVTTTIIGTVLLISAISCMVFYLGFKRLK